MSPFGSLVASLLAATPADDTFTGPELAAVLRWLSALDEWRVYVDGTKNLGHQAATVAAMKRLILRTGYAGAITVVHTDGDKVKPGSTVSKLALLLTGVDPAAIGSQTLAFGSCQRIRFLDYARRGELTQACAFGFTGAADDMTVNLARELNVDWFLRLQPYLWDDEAARRDDPYYESSRLERPDGTLRHLVDECPPFRQLACKTPAALVRAIPDETWAWYADRQAFDAGLRTRTRNARALLTSSGANLELLLWPVYGLHHFRDRQPFVALNIALAAGLCQQRLRRPVVVAFLNDHHVARRCGPLLHALARDVSARRSVGLRFQRALERTIDARSPQGVGPDREGGGVMDIVTGHARGWRAEGLCISVISGYGAHDARDITGRLESIGGVGPDALTLVFLGPVPGDVFNHLFATAALPGVFEGQATSSLAISLGRPFLQLDRKAEVVHDNYPASIGGIDYHHLAARARSAASRIVEPLGVDRATAGSEGPSSRSGLTEVADFLVESQDPASAVRQYFDALGAYYRADAHDKLLLGLLALGDGVAPAPPEMS